MRPAPHLIGLAAFALAGLVCILAAIWAASVVEARSATGVRRALEQAGHPWADVESDGLRVVLSGTAPTEAMRFRALAVAGTVVDAARVIDAMQVPDAAALAAPDFSVEVLRNDDGISLIGLIPAVTEREALVESLAALAANGNVTDLMETASHPVPEGWRAALSFGIDALRILPRAKISISASRVAVTAITDSAAEKARIEAELIRKAPKSLQLALDISAPRPVITPFTLRFLIDAEGARFDACSADTERTRTRILAAAAAAGAEGKTDCTIGLGVPSPQWAEAAAAAIAALAELGAGSVTLSDADISLIAADSVAQGDFDRVTGELEAKLPEVFSLTSILTERPRADAGQGPPEFTATLNPGGQVQLRGRLTDERMRGAVENFARARFGHDAVYAAMRLDPELPDGWPVRVLAALEALGELASGSVTVQPGMVRVAGVTGSTEARAAIARMLSARLGEGAQYAIEVRYDEKLDPILGLPTPEQCASGLNAILSRAKIPFEPGSAIIAPEARATLDAIGELMKTCTDYPMEIGGHTDSQGREEMNQLLSQERAEAVIEALRDRRILTGHLIAVGYGEARPIADNGTEAGREANRRIEFRLLDQQAALAPEEGAETADGTDATEGEDEADIVIPVQEPEEGDVTPLARPDSISGSSVPEEDAEAEEAAEPADETEPAAEGETAEAETGDETAEAAAETPAQTEDEGEAEDPATAENVADDTGTEAGADPAVETPAEAADAAPQTAEDTAGAAEAGETPAGDAAEAAETPEAEQAARDATPETPAGEAETAAETPGPASGDGIEIVVQEPGEGDVRPLPRPASITGSPAREADPASAPDPANDPVEELPPVPTDGDGAQEGSGD